MSWLQNKIESQFRLFPKWGNNQGSVVFKDKNKFLKTGALSKRTTEEREKLTQNQKWEGERVWSTCSI